MILSRCRLLTVNTPSSLLMGMPPGRCHTLITPYASAHRPSPSPLSSFSFLVARSLHSRSLPTFSSIGQPLSHKASVGVRLRLISSRSTRT